MLLNGRFAGAEPLTVKGYAVISSSSCRPSATAVALSCMAIVCWYDAASVPLSPSTAMVSTTEAHIASTNVNPLLPRFLTRNSHLTTRNFFPLLSGIRLGAAGVGAMDDAGARIKEPSRRRVGGRADVGDRRRIRQRIDRRRLQIRPIGRR